MTTHPPAVGVIPQPTQCNVLNQNKLQNHSPVEPATLVRSDLNGELGWLRCEVCTDQFNLSGGYTFLDDFVCDRCMRDLVALTGGANVQ